MQHMGEDPPSTGLLPNSSELIEKPMDFFVPRKREAFSDQLAYYISIINIVCICTIMSIFGIFTNIINLIVLKRQGFLDNVNIILFAIAISDLLSLVTILWVAICYNPLFSSLDLPFLPLEIELLTGEMPHAMAMNATSWLTVYVTLERCLCIVFPLKVKDILTRKRTKAVIFLISIMVITSQIPTYVSNRLEWKYDFKTNRTVYGLVVKDDYLLLDTITLFITNVLGPTLSFILVIICSIILVVQLSQKSKWRQMSVANTKNESAMGARDRKVVKMVLAVAVIFITSYTPSVLVFIFTAVDPEITPTGSLANNYMVSVSVAFVFETFNASINIFIYYNMSSRYRGIFRAIFFGESAKG